jgi:hypothetical protein
VLPHACVAAVWEQWRRGGVPYLTCFTGTKVQILTQLEQSCCRTLVLPLYGSRGGGGVFPAFSAYTAEAQHVRDLVANGNVLVVVGGTMVSERTRR